MKHQRNFVSALFSMLVFGGLALASAHAETRVALVIGNANYPSGVLPTPANDAGLIAQTLQAAGFDVVGVRDLDQDSLRKTFRDFIAKVSAAGPDTVAFIYLSGYGLQLEGENYFVPTDANIVRDVNVASEALRVSDYTKPLAALGIKASMVILDGARANPFAKSGSPLAGGLALVEPDPGTLIAFNAAPGTVVQNEAGSYSAYAQALAEMMREGGLPVTDIFDRVRLRVNETTKGAQVPWNASKLQAPFYFFERAPDAPPPQVSPEQTASNRSKPIRDFDAREAYLAALDRDDLQDYENFLVAYPNDPMARRVLRRSHDHHRSLRARCSATASANRSNDRNQARHLMTPSQSRKSDRRVRWLSTGHGRARSDIRPSAQIGQTATAFDANQRRFMHRFALAQLPQSRRPQSATALAALKSP